VTLRRIVLLVAALVFVSVLAAGCGKRGGSGAVAGTYHLVGAEEATSLEIRADGTFTLRRDSCASIGDLACGDWRPQTAWTAVIAPRDYWPTPATFPSARVDRLEIEARDGELVVVGENAWFGTFTQRWVPGRVCETCDERSFAGREGPCQTPMPVCWPRL